MRVLVTRPQADQAQTLSALADLGLSGLSCPVLDVDWLDFAIPLEPWQAVVATSRNGLRALAAEDLASLVSVPLFVVGRKTEILAVELGFRQVSPASRDAAHLGQGSLGQLSAEAGPILYLTARHRSGNLVEELEQAGFGVHLVELYQTKAVDRWPEDIIQNIKNRQLGGVLLYSARTARLFVERLDQYGLDDAATNLTFFCLSPAVASVLSERDYPLVVAEAPNEASLLASVRNAHNY